MRVSKRRSPWGQQGGVLILAGIVAAAAALTTGGVLRIRRAQRERRVVGAPRPAEPGDILLFFRPNRARDYLIEWVTSSRFYHAALAVGDGTVIEARPAGVIHNDLRGREEEYDVLPGPCGKGPAALAWARTQLGQPFDRRDMLVIGLEHLFRRWRINYARPGYYSCGELVATAYEKVGVELIPDKEPGEVAPGDIARLLPKAGQSVDAPEPRGI